YGFSKHVPDINIRTPKTAVIGTDEFEYFIDRNNLRDFVLIEDNYEIIKERFISSRLTETLSKRLKIILRKINNPIAIRSSGLFEDSLMQPFAGIFETYLLPNNHPDPNVRLQQVMDAIKLVFASVYSDVARGYFKAVNYKIEEEKMAVIIQQIVGEEYNGRFYPVVSGVAQSYNFYPISHMEPEEGIVQLALGLGPLIVEGGQVYRFSSKYPEMNPPFSNAVEFLKKSQNVFYALETKNSPQNIGIDEKFNLKKYSLDKAEDDGTLFFVASTFSGQDNAIKDTISVEGPRVITFANILKHGLFPLAEILNEILEIGKKSFGSHIEIEFAINLSRDKGRIPEFHLLQIRPMVAGGEPVEIEMGGKDPSDIICSTLHPMGNGRISDIRDIVYIDPEKFNISQSRKIALEIENINKKIVDEDRKYVLIGFGRWGTSDPWLGIPVEWHQISGAKVVIESFIKDFRIDPSLGSHFFHNMISLQMGYFHINDKVEDEYINWELLQRQKPETETKYIKHLRFDDPLSIIIDAKNSKGKIYLP
ncbi:MAG: phosphoenolpyruvate synthase, partial [Candidatus Aminicenantes bacterium]|nr:phosphoenolpyruvate synthase [Candidatus Aminicenantes bacterium]